MHIVYFITADYKSENSASVFDIIYSTVFCFCCIQIQAMKDLQSWAPIYRLRKVHTYMGQCWNKSTCLLSIPTYLLRYLRVREIYQYYFNLCTDIWPKSHRPISKTDQSYLYSICYYNTIHWVHINVIFKKKRNRHILNVPCASCYSF